MRPQREYFPVMKLLRMTMIQIVPNTSAVYFRLRRRSPIHSAVKRNLDSVNCYNNMYPESFLLKQTQLEHFKEFCPHLRRLTSSELIIGECQRMHLAI